MTEEHATPYVDDVPTPGETEIISYDPNQEAEGREYNEAEEGAPGPDGLGYQLPPPPGPAPELVVPDEDQSAE